MGHDARTVDYAALSTAQRLALVDIVYRGGIELTQWGYEGTVSHRRPTIMVLVKRGLCKFTPTSGDAGGVDPTPRGKAVVSNEFRGKTPSFADLDNLGRLRRSN